MKKYKLKLIAIIISAVFLFTLGGCEDKINDNSSSESILSSLSESEQTQESSLSESIVEDSSLSSVADVVSQVSAVSAAAVQTANSTVQSENNDVSSCIPIQDFNTYRSGGTQEFIDWINSGGNSNEENATFLSATKEYGKLLIPVTLNPEIEEKSNSVVKYKKMYEFHSIIGKDTDPTTSKYFTHYIVFMDEKDCEMSLYDLYIKYFTDKDIITNVKQGIWKNIEYCYTDYKEDPDVNKTNYSLAWFKTDGFLVLFQQGHSLKLKPFNPEYLDYFDYKIVDLNIQK